MSFIAPRDYFSSKKLSWAICWATFRDPWAKISWSRWIRSQPGWMRGRLSGCGAAESSNIPWQRDQKVRFHFCSIKIFQTQILFRPGTEKCDFDRHSNPWPVSRELRPDSRPRSQVRDPVFGRQDGLHEGSQKWDPNFGISLSPEPPEAPGGLRLGRRVDLQIHRPVGPETHHPREHHGEFSPPTCFVESVFWLDQLRNGNSLSRSLRRGWESASHSLSLSRSKSLDGVRVFFWRKRAKAKARLKPLTSFFSNLFQPKNKVSLFCEEKFAATLVSDPTGLEALTLDSIFIHFLSQKLAPFFIF